MTLLLLAILGCASTPSDSDTGNDASRNEVDSGVAATSDYQAFIGVGDDFQIAIDPGSVVQVIGCWYENDAHQLDTGAEASQVCADKSGSFVVRDGMLNYNDEGEYTTTNDSYFDAYVYWSE